MKPVFLDIGTYLNYPNHYAAHDCVNKSRETLEEHTILTQKYYEQLYIHKEVDYFLEKFIKTELDTLSSEGIRFFFFMFHNIVTFHDFGKVNLRFQKKLNKTDKTDIMLDCPDIGSEHSIVSAIMYIDYYKKGLKLLSKEDREQLLSLLYFNSYVIAKHHSDLDDFSSFATKFQIKECDSIFKILQENDRIIKEPFTLQEKFVISNLDFIANKSNTKDYSIAINAYCRMAYSLLVASDYYATTQYMSDIEVKNFGNLEDINSIIKCYEETKVVQAIRRYEKDKQYSGNAINVLRTELFLEAEEMLMKNLHEDIFYLEAPTGSGKSNTAFNLSFQLVKHDRRISKIFYVYPFNTLVEQNIEVLIKTFDDHQAIIENIAVVNSTTPIKVRENEDGMDDYGRALLDRQFLNYPMILTTHVSLFDILFGNRKESVFGFHQLMHSVIVLDEIQSYRNSIWSEIIALLKGFARLLNLKIIIMSATLPNLHYLLQDETGSVRLIGNRDKYFSHTLFKDRVKIHYDLLIEREIESALFEHVLINLKATEPKKILVEFVKKTTAEAFYRRIMEMKDASFCAMYLSGDDNIYERKKILDFIRNNPDKRILLIATQVIEAGVDIDMDIGYKNISLLDSEEQFLGRINRSCLREGHVYFFNWDNSESLYRSDVRCQYTLLDEKIQEILRSKNFPEYYNWVMTVLQKNFTENRVKGLQYFLTQVVGKLDFASVSKHMKLIDDSDWKMSVYLARTLTYENEVIDGLQLWKEYVELLQDDRMEYAMKKVKCSMIKSKMNLFIYQIPKNNNFDDCECIGDLILIENGEDYFTDNKLDSKKLNGNRVSFL